MPTTEELRKGWRERLGAAAIDTTPSLREAGLMLGAGTVLAPRERDRWGRPALAIDDNGERVLALLVAAYRRPTALPSRRRPSTISAAPPQPMRTARRRWR